MNATSNRTWVSLNNQGRTAQYKDGYLVVVENGDVIAVFTVAADELNAWAWDLMESVQV